MTTHIRSTGKLSYDDYVLIPDDGQRHEIIEGQHFVNPAPNTYHQTLSKRLQYELYRQIELAGRGIVFDAPVDVQLSPHDIVQPDLVVVLRNREQIITYPKLVGAPDLVVEITSPSTAQFDRTRKRELYARAGVREYWIVDAEQRRLEQLQWVAGRYESAPPTDEVRPHICPDVLIRLDDIW